MRNLTNLDHWVFFDAPEVEMLDFLAYKHQGHYYFKFHVIPGKGPIARLASSDIARQVVAEYWEYYNAKPLSSALGKLSPEAPRTQRTAAKSGSFSSDDRNSSFGQGFSWADEMEAHLSEVSDDISAEEHTSEGTSPVPGDDMRALKPAARKLRQVPVKPAIEEQLVRPGNVRPQRGMRKAGLYNACHAEAGESCTDAVLRVLKTNDAAKSQGNAGWEALRLIWHIGPADLDNAVLSCLNAKTPKQQQHILLSFAAIDLSYVHNLSAYLNCLIKEHDSTNQVCLYFLAGLCTDERCCWVHPVNTRGWNLLRERWQITYKDLDYTVLNFLSKKTIPEQDNILSSLADMDLTIIHNLPAYLSSMIQKYDGFPSHSRGGRRPKDLKPRHSHHDRRQPPARHDGHVRGLPHPRSVPLQHEAWYPPAAQRHAPAVYSHYEEEY